MKALSVAILFMGWSFALILAAVGFYAVTHGLNAYGVWFLFAAATGVISVAAACGVEYA